MNYRNRASREVVVEHRSRRSPPVFGARRGSASPEQREEVFPDDVPSRDVSAEVDEEEPHGGGKSNPLFENANRFFKSASDDSIAETPKPEAPPETEALTEATQGDTAQVGNTAETATPPDADQGAPRVLRSVNEVDPLQERIAAEAAKPKGRGKGAKNRATTDQTEATGEVATTADAPAVSEAAADAATAAVEKEAPRLDEGWEDNPAWETAPVKAPRARRQKAAEQPAPQNEPEATEAQPETPEPETASEDVTSPVAPVAAAAIVGAGLVAATIATRLGFTERLKLQRKGIIDRAGNPVRPGSRWKQRAGNKNRAKGR